MRGVHIRRLLGLLLAGAAVVPLGMAKTALAQAGPRAQISHTAENLRGVSTVSQQIAWASGTHGTYLQTSDGGRTWTAAQVPDAAGLDFRGVVAFSADEAFLMSSGPGNLSRIFHTMDGGQHWQLQFTNTNPKGFFDSMVFWDRTHGVVLGDPIADQSGKLKFEVLATDDGEHWQPTPTAQMPPALEGEGAFAASNTCLAILHSSSDTNIWFATGGKAARVFHSSDRGQNWEVFDTPLPRSIDSSGIFSIAFRDAMHGVIAGGDYKHPNDDGPNLAFTEDGGKTWTLSPIHPQAYFSAVAYDRKVQEEATQQQAELAKAQSEGKKIRVKPAPPQRIFIIGEDFVFDFNPPSNPRRISGKKRLGVVFNAVSAYPGGGALTVGPKGTIALIP